MFNHDGNNLGKGKYAFQWNSQDMSLNGYYVTTGLPRMIKKVFLPDGLGTAEFQNYSTTKIERDNLGFARLAGDSLRKTRVIDAEGTHEATNGRMGWFVR